MNPPVLLVTAGPSREAIDDVRFLSNGSSGRMGIEVARKAQELEQEVTETQAAQIELDKTAEEFKQNLVKAVNCQDSKRTI